LLNIHETMRYFCIIILIVFCSEAWAQIDTIPGRAIFTNGFSSYVDTRFNQHLPRFTVECWTKSPQIPNERQGKGPVHFEENFQLNWDHVQNSARHAFVMRDSAGSWHPASFGDEWEANTWYHLAGTYDGETMRAYRNGKLITTNTNPLGPARQETATLKIGKHARLSGPQFEFHEGTTDEVRVWSRALSEEEIRENMHKTLNGDELGLVLYYQFNEWPVQFGFDSTLEKVSGRYSAILVQNPQRRESTAPVGKALSASATIISTPSAFNLLDDMRFVSTQIAQEGQLTATSMLTSAVGDTFANPGSKLIYAKYWIVNSDHRLNCRGKTQLLVPEDLYFSLSDFQTKPTYLFHRASNSDSPWIPVMRPSQETPMGRPFIFMEFDTLLNGQFTIGRLDTTALTKLVFQNSILKTPCIYLETERQVTLIKNGDELKFQLIHLDGRILLEKELNSEKSETFQIGNQIAAGIFLWRMNKKNEVLRGKIYLH